MLHYFITIILILSIFSTAKTQDIHSDTLAARQLKKNLPEDKQKAFGQLQEAAKLYEKHNLQELYSETLLNASFYTDNDYETIIEKRKKLLNTILKEFKSNTKLIVRAYKALGIAYSNKGEFKNAIEQFQLAEKTLKESPNYSKIELVNIHLELIINYSRLGDSQRTSNYISSAETLARQIKSTQLPLANLLRFKTELDADNPDALTWINEAISKVEQDLGTNSPKLFNFIHTKAIVYYRRKNSPKAVEIMKALIDKKKAYYGSTNNLDVARSYIDLGLLYKGWKNFKESEEEKKKNRALYLPVAIEHYLEAARIYEVLGIKVEANLAVLYRNLGNLYQRQKNYDKALESFHKGILALLPNETNTDHNKVLPIANTNKICISWSQVFLLTRAKLVAFKQQYIKENNKEAGHRMLESILEIDAILDENAKSISNDALQSIFGDRDKFVTAATIRMVEHYYTEFKTPTLLNQIHRIFEKNKNSQLLSTLQSSQESQLGNIDKKLLEEEARLKKEIGKAKKKLLDASTQRDSLAIQKNQARILELHVEYEQFLKELAIKDPNYHNLKYAVNIPNIAALQKQLKENEAIIDYQTRGDNIVIIYIEEDTAYAKFLKIKNIGTRIKKLRYALTSKSLLKNSPKTIYKNYIHAAHQLHQDLGLDSLIVSKEINHLTIVPSEELNYIPFEALLCSLPQDSSDVTNYKNLDYLINHYNISYAYSTSLWHQTMQKKTSGSKGILGFAASYKDPSRWENIGRSDKLQKLRNHLIDLPGAQTELEELQKNYAGNFFFNEAANEKQFKELDRSQYSIIHLAMHGLLNKEHAFASSLAFSENGDTTEDNFVFAYELTQIPITTDLVVLSACETGYGKFKHGEGVASLARSFMYAGTPSLIMTLWEVNDFSTAQIMQFFYEGLYNGLNKPVALQQAKREYLSRAKGIASHPFFWAPFVQLGNTNPIKVYSKNHTWYWQLGIGVGALAILMLGFIGWRLKRKKQELSS
ncbi:MAG: CHAT domain-containing protein [Aureispira sp.]|nr:CHAT domain-containing protein [Aureispira sp.]